MVKLKLGNVSCLKLLLKKMPEHCEWVALIIVGSQLPKT